MLGFLLLNAILLALVQNTKAQRHRRPGTPRQPSPSRLAPFAEEHRYGLINDSYIVMLNPAPESSSSFSSHSPSSPIHVSEMMQNHFNYLQAAHQSNNVYEGVYSIGQVYAAWNGYAATFSASMVEELRTLPEVRYIERDQVMKTQGAPAVQTNAPWGLARLSQRETLPSSGDSLIFSSSPNSDSSYTYKYDPTGGQGVDVYVIDTGIDTHHPEFEGRAVWGKTIATNGGDTDTNGHGTHCAGTIGSRTYGVAKQARLLAVKVLGSDGSGSMSDVLAGVDWAVQDAQAKRQAAKQNSGLNSTNAYRGAVVSMSLGGGKSVVLDMAVNGAVESGIHFAVAAGNDNQNACNYSPASAAKVLTVGASTIKDEAASFSNVGPCVDVFAPGLNILSTYIGEKGATKELSGTSMAAPHAAGLIAYFLSIYPSSSFDPPRPSSQSTAAHQQPFSIGPPVNVGLGSGFLSGILPFPINNPASDITPEQLKSALMGLASRGQMPGIRQDTTDRLLFNNASAISG